MADQQKLGTFDKVLPFIRNGGRAERAGWNGKGQFIFYVDGSEFMVNRQPLLNIYKEGTWVAYRPHIDFRAADGTIGVWSPSQSDILANDWLTAEGWLEGVKLGSVGEEQP